jgi:hypothetical protein
MEITTSAAIFADYAARRVASPGVHDAIVSRLGFAPKRHAPMHAAALALALMEIDGKPLAGVTLDSLLRIIGDDK